MSFTLRIDSAQWRRGLQATIEDEPRTVPVIKGNGYGFGVQRLAVEAADLPVDTIAVGTNAEARVVQEAFGREVLVLTPWHPAYAAGDHDSVPGTIRTLSHAEAVLELATRDEGTPVIIEVLTSMRRHGIAADELALLLRPLESLDVRGYALHLPIDRGAGYDAAAEVDRWAGALADAGLSPKTLWVSHLSSTEMARVRAFLPGADVRPRIGTSLWLDDRSAFTVQATVLDVHRVARGDRVGYRQRKAQREGYVVVVSGGTANGVGLEAPAAAKGVSGRGKAVARGGLEALGRAHSPFRLAGKRLWFAEPPHMQVSMLWLPGDTVPPAIGSDLTCQVRMTTATFDHVEGI